MGEDESRPRMSRRNDLNEFSYNDKNVVVDPLQLFQTKNVAQPSLSMTQPTIIVPEARTLLMNPNTQHNSIGGLAYSESGKILEIPSGMFEFVDIEESKPVDSTFSNRRMDIGTDDYEYIDEPVDNDATTYKEILGVESLIQDISDTDEIAVKDKTNSEEINVDIPNIIDNDEFDRTSSEVSPVEDAKDAKDNKTTSSATTSPFTPPRPVYVVYPDNQDSSSTSSASDETISTSTELTSSIKMFDIEYDQFS